MGYIRNQIRFQPFVLHARFYRYSYAFADAVDCPGQCQIIAMKMILIYLMFKVTFLYFLNSFHNALPVFCIMVDQYPESKIKDSRNGNSFPSEKNEDQIDNKEYEIRKPGFCDHIAVIINFPCCRPAAHRCFKDQAFLP